MSKQTLQGYFLKLAKKRLQHRLGQFERLNAELETGNSLTQELDGLFYSKMELPFISSMNKWHLLDNRLLSLIDDWSAIQPEASAVTPLPPVAKPEEALIETISPVLISTQIQAEIAKTSTVAKVQVGDDRLTEISSLFTMTKAALIKQHKHQWLTIEGDIAGANRNGLSAAAKAGMRRWNESNAIEWARNNAKLTSTETSVNVLTNAMHRMSNFPVLRNKL